MSQVTVYHPTNVSAAINQASTNFAFSLKDGGKVDKTGCIRFYATANAVPVGGSAPVKNNLVVCVTEKDPPIIITRGGADPSDKTNIAVIKKFKPSVSTTIGKAGALGQLYLQLEREYVKFTADNAAVFKTVCDKVTPMISRVYSNVAAETRRGQARDDPVITLNVSFDKWPSKHPIDFLRDQPKTIILDYNKFTIVQQQVGSKVVGIKKYQPMRVKVDDNLPDSVESNWVPVDEKNFFKVSKAGVRIMRARIFLDNGNVSATNGSSYKGHIQEMVLDCNIKPGFTDDVAEESDNLLDERNAMSSMTLSDDSNSAPGNSAGPTPEEVLNALGM